MTAMIDIADANKTFTMHLQGGIELPVVSGVTFHVDPGECVTCCLGHQAPENRRS